jgi:signal transduction histidine kinase
LSRETLLKASGRSPAIQVSADDEAAWVVFSVRDNGIGIALHHQQRIFKIFERVHSEKKFEGTGIGLAIVRRRVERMGGTVGVESELGKGKPILDSAADASGI